MGFTNVLKSLAKDLVGVQEPLPPLPLPPNFQSRSQTRPPSHPRSLSYSEHDFINPTDRRASMSSTVPRGRPLTRGPTPSFNGSRPPPFPPSRSSSIDTMTSSLFSDSSRSTSRSSIDTNYSAHGSRSQSPSMPLSRASSRSNIRRTSLNSAINDLIDSESIPPMRTPSRQGQYPETPQFTPRFTANGKLQNPENIGPSDCLREEDASRILDADAAGMKLRQVHRNDEIAPLTEILYALKKQNTWEIENINRFRKALEQEKKAYQQDVRAREQAVSQLRAEFEMDFAAMKPAEQKLAIQLEGMNEKHAMDDRGLGRRLQLNVIKLDQMIKNNNSLARRIKTQQNQLDGMVRKERWEEQVRAHRAGMDDEAYWARILRDPPPQQKKSLAPRRPQVWR